MVLYNHHLLINLDLLYQVRFPRGSISKEECIVKKIDNTSLNDLLFAKNGSIATDYTESRGLEEMNKNEICLKIQMGRGSASSTMWTTDLSYDYVKINSEYRT